MGDSNRLMQLLAHCDTPMLKFEKMLGAPVPEIPKDTDMTGAQADELMLKLASDNLP